jgi:membrane-associated phospholipid phosphatase
MESSRTILRPLFAPLIILGIVSWLFLDIPLSYRVFLNPVPALREVTWVLGRPGQTTFWIVGCIFVWILARRKSSFCPTHFRDPGELNRFFLQLAVGLIISGIVVTLLKYIVGRPRPSEFFLRGVIMFQHFSNSPRYASFPSGHSQTVWCGIATLLLFFPRYRKLLIVLGILGCIGRIIMLRHYPSDIFAGALIGIWGAAAAQVFAASTWLTNFFKSRLGIVIGQSSTAEKG